MNQFSIPPDPNRHHLLSCVGHHVNINILSEMHLWPFDLMLD